MIVERDHPYIYARIAAKRNRLLDADDFEEMSRTSPDEIARMMEEGVYRDQVNRFGRSHSGARLVELAAQSNLSKEMQHLESMAPSKLKPLLSRMSEKSRTQTLRRAIRWSRDSDVDAQSITPGIDIEEEELAEMSDHELAESLGLQQYQDSLDSDRPELEIEKLYYERLLEAAEHPAIRELVEMSVQERDTVTSLRLMAYGTETGEITEYLLNPENLPAGQEDKAFEDLSDELGTDVDSVRFAERALRRRTLKHGIKMLRSEPLSARPVAGYVVAKRNEVRNLESLANALESGIDRERAMEEIVTA
nr:MAG: archaeal/vacuolar-type H+ ATPase subunit C [Candidatus Nanosalinarum sp. J07AB56]